jgi:hypothetical protein
VYPSTVIRVLCLVVDVVAQMISAPSGVIRALVPLSVMSPRTESVAAPANSTTSLPDPGPPVGSAVRSSERHPFRIEERT